MAKLDGFTAAALLETAKTDIEGTADIYKALHECSEGAPNEEQVKWVESHIGKRVKIKHTTHTGVITRLNTAESGFYPGGRYPVIVKLDNGYTFEYGIDFIILDEDSTQSEAS